VDATELHVNNPAGDTRIELGGTGNVYMDLKNPNSDDYDLRIQASGTDPRILTNSAKLLVDGTVVALQSVTNGDVGIGTNAPAVKLDIVESQTGQTVARVYNSDIAGVASAGYIAHQGGVIADFLAEGNTELSLGTQTAHPVIIKSNNADQIYLTPSGDVGIGVAIPTAKLNIQDSSSSAIVKITQQGSGPAIVVEDTTTDTTPFIINGDGDVGIGTATPNYNLDILTSSEAAIGNRTTGGGSRFIGQNTTGYLLQNESNTPMSFLTNNSERMRITETGDVGIGTPTPTAKLHVVGGIRSTTATDGIGYGTGAGGAATVAGTGTGQTVTINKICGTITCASAAGSTTRKAVVVTNSTVGEFDTVIISGKGGANSYESTVFNVKTGEFSFQYASPTGTASETPLFNFAVIKSVNA
jgi:hypothetical protein